MDHKIVGTVMPVLEVTLDPNDAVVSVAGELSWMTQNMQIETSTQHGGGGGMFGAFKRMAGGGTFFMTKFQPSGGSGMVAFATKVPGAILQVDVTADKPYMIHRHGFLCATPEVELGVGFQQRLGAGVFGGNGFVLQRLGGNCQAWVELDGEVMTYDLNAGETLLVHPGHVGMFESTVTFDIRTIKGIKNVLFGGQGLFLAELTGPGKIWLQSLPLPNLAHALEPYLDQDNNTGEAAAAGGVAGSIMRGMSQQ